MNDIFAVSIKRLFEFILPFAVFLLTLLLGYFLRKVLFSRLSRWARNTRSQIDDVVIGAAKGPFVIWCLMSGIYFALAVAKLPQGLVNISGKIILLLGISSITVVLANISANLVKIYSQKLETALAVSSLTQNITRIIIFVIGILVILNSLGISIAPILATLGVGGLAVALALQDTLSNLFAGFHIIVARQIKIGDYVKLESGEEGYVIDINWRTTKIKALPNNIILVPNEKVTKAIITNYYLPDKELAVLVNLGVHYNSDLEKVEKITCETAREVMKEIAGAVPEFEPFIRYNGLGEFSINFTVILRAKEFVDQYLIKHEFIKRLHGRYKREGIIIPYPIRAINYQQEKGE